MASGTKRQIDVARLQGGSGRGQRRIVKRALRRRPGSSPVFRSRTIVAFGERRALQRAIYSAEALHRFFSQIEAQINQDRRREPVRQVPSPCTLITSPSCESEATTLETTTYFSTRINSPVEALTATVSLAPSRAAP